MLWLRQGQPCQLAQLVPHELHYLLGSICPALSLTGGTALAVAFAPQHRTFLPAPVLQVKEIALEGTWTAEESRRKAHQHDAAAAASEAAEAASSAAEAAAAEAPAGRGRWLHW